MADAGNGRGGGKRSVLDWRTRTVYFLAMKLPPLTAVIEKDEDWFVATCPELGVASQGRSIEEAEAMIKEAVELLLEEADEREIQRRLNRGVKVTRLEPAHA
jgi:predicted RNase H-like HicB family nuclease